MLAKDLRKKFLQFFEEKGHKAIPSASLLPEHDPTVLFTTAGMHPLVPFLLGNPHPLGKRLANCQKCLRTDDIDKVGDASHHTFFEMLGNWSLGDYFKKEAIEMSYEFLTSKKWLGLDPSKLSITVFEGDEDAPRDEESIKVWLAFGIPRERIFLNPKKDNWWGPAGRTGPCGPCTEMFFDIGKPKCSPDCRPGCGCGKYFEVWNDVFMEYNKTENGYEKLKQHNVDTGMGLERTAAILQGKDNDYETELFLPIMQKIRELGKTRDEKSARIIVDHLRAAVFVLGDDRRIIPSNVDQGYVLRRLIRRAIRHGRRLGIEKNFCKEVADVVINISRRDYPELERNRAFIFDELDNEESRFRSALSRGVREFEHILKEKGRISGKDAFLLFQSYGFPPEMTREMASEHGLVIDFEEFDKEFKAHQELSRAATERKFKSGLADFSEDVIKLHTATHLLHAALRKVLGTHVQQKGSNITAERLRFDFSHDRKMSDEELKKVEELVNEQIRKGIPVVKEEMTLAEARAKGAVAFFEEKYDRDKVFVFTVGDFSKEVCSGPHVKSTSELGHFKIMKEEAISVGVRRIRAVLTKEIEPRYISH